MRKGLIVVALLSIVRPCWAEDRIDFNQQIRPILSRNCFACHGRDEKKREADLRLDTRAGATADLDGRHAIVPGKSGQSELYKRITSGDDDERMPPPDSGKKLTPGEIKLLQVWIDDGAPYAKHWSLVPPARPKLPAVKDKSWPKSPLDYFVLARLEAAGLRPSPEADRYALIRRASLDLRGLPPTLEEIDAFVKDDSPRAYERLVDRLLASPRLATASAGPASGSIWPAMPTRRVTRKIGPARCGRGAIGSSRHSTTTCRSTASRSSSWPAICCPARRRSKSWPPLFIATR